MSMQTPPGKTLRGVDRRRFFRIDDRLLLSLRRVAEEAPASTGNNLRGSGALQDIDRRILSIIAAARVQAPAVAELAEQLNRKLDHVIDTLQLSEELSERAAYREHQVNLSACGLAMHTAQHFEPTEQLLLQLRFSSGEARLQLLARVVSCEPREEGDFLLHLDFAGISPDDQEFLIQYIMRRQGSYLQELREQRDQQPAPRRPRKP